MRIALLLLLMAGMAAHGEEITVAAAADLTYCLPEINAGFEKANPGATVKATFGSSGNFFAQIKSGAPFDVFLSADMQYPTALEKAGMAGTAEVYAEGRLALWTMNDSVDVSKGLAVLGDAGVKRVAIANPAHAPYGRAAKAALEHEKLWDMVSAKLVQGENIAQTAQFVQTGNADAGLVALSLVMAPAMAGKGHYYIVPAVDYPAIEQAATVTKAGSGKGLAGKYVEYLKSDEARKILERYGFGLPK
jgi:molybdate transport system substrate-binding protein